MLGPADIDAWIEDLPTPSVEPARSPMVERDERRRAILARLALGHALTFAEWRELRAGFLGR